ncbi:MAG: hypothetical protein HY904_12590 [Deltaproteobacteria bacterium]|nr:hypothetical protein [Deltaproteobacteria bacterium]
MPVRTSDTTPDAARFQAALYDAMDPAARVAVAAAMSDDAREVTMNGIRTRHPEYTDIEVQHALFVILHGPQVVARVWGGSAVVPP